MKNTIVVFFKKLVLWIESSLILIKNRLYYCPIVMIKWMLEIVYEDRLKNYILLYICFMSKINTIILIHSES